MRVYFRHARSVERRVSQAMDEVPLGKAAAKLSAARSGSAKAEVESRAFVAEFHGVEPTVAVVLGRGG